jgi:Uma2 family endonuclease
MILVGDIAHTLPVDHPSGISGARWTVDDYLAMPEDGHRYELLEGTLYMTPAPRVPHQETLGEIHHWLKLRLAGNPPRAKTLVAPVDVFLAPDTVVQPDLLVITPDRLDLLKIDGFHGAPSLVIEIASPGTATYDRHDKLQAYAKAGVAEYWLVDTTAKTLEILVLREGKYRIHALVTGPSDIPSMVIGTQAGPVSGFFV